MYFFHQGTPENQRNGAEKIITHYTQSVTIHHQLFKTIKLVGLG